MFSTTDLLVGVDIHLHTNVVQVMDEAGQILSPQLRVANNRSSIAGLVSQLAQTAAEVTGNYWLPFFCELEQSSDLAAWSLSLYPFNPKVIHKSLGDWNNPDETTS